ncbi:phage head completion protein [Piscibacillus salipiscarius]|uniref:Head-tail adaptor protein n=1 Tax=Piscibacillus salipiscarius TaxID=299480 RepID=A0ABW5Q730_9BACI
MRNFKYKPPRVHTGELRTPVIFYEYVPNEGPYPGEKEKNELFRTWAKVDEVWLRDAEQAKANGTLSDITITIRDPQAEYIPNNKHYVEIDAPEYQNKRYNVKQAQPDLQHKSFINVIASLTS